MKIIILGPPGTGKGTQAKIISKEFNLKHISTGEIFRAEFNKKTKWGLEAQSYWGSGSLVPGEVTINLIKNNMPKDNFILDGFPRNVEQAKELEKITKIDYVINIDSDKKTIIKRLLRRAKIEGRKDDTPAVIKKRFGVYEKETKPLLKFYKSNLVNINGNKPVDEIFNSIKKVLNNVN